MASDRAAARRALGDRGQGRSQWPGGDGWTKPLYRNLPAFGCGRKGGYKHYPLAPTTTGRIVREPGPEALLTSCTVRRLVDAPRLNLGDGVTQKSRQQTNSKTKEAVMRITALVPTVVIAMGGIVGSVSADDEFVTLKNVKSTPMSSSELAAVKGQAAHFATPSSNAGHPNGPNANEGWHFVNIVNQDNWVDLGNGILVGPGYHGLCGAALNSPKMSIPGQNPITGIGGGC